MLNLLIVTIHLNHESLRALLKCRILDSTSYILIWETWGEKTSALLQKQLRRFWCRWWVDHLYIRLFQHHFFKPQFSSVQSLSCVWLFATPWTAAHQASLSTTSSQSLTQTKLMSIESVMPSNHVILCPPLCLLSSIFPSIRVFSNESVLPIMWPKY